MKQQQNGNQATMNMPLLTFMREDRRFSATVAALTAFFFIFVFYSPSALAIKTDIEQTQQTKAIIKGKTAEEKLSNTLQSIKEHVKKNKGKIKGRVAAESGIIENVLDIFGLSTLATEDTDTLNQLNDNAQQLHEDALANFANIEAELKEKGLPDEILQRHYDAVEKYQAEYQQYQDKIKQLNQADSLFDQETAMEDLDTFLDKQQFKRSHQPFDPNNLPFSTPKAKDTRKPITEEKELKKMLGQELDESTVLNTLSNSLIPNAHAANGDEPTPADLAETIDVQITAAIQQKADELNNHPVEIYNWVRNNIEFIPTYGSVQGSEMTLLNQQGNAFDTASLLIALLRASDIPARYVYGTVEMPVEQFANWVGADDNAEKASQIFAQGGIPHTALVSGGVIKAIRFEHLWVETWVDFEPSRGAKNIQGDSWAPMDASFKQYSYSDGIGLDAVVPLDEAGVTNALLDGAQIDETEGSLTSLGEEAFETAISAYSEEVKLYLENNQPDATFGDILGMREIVQSSSPVLATGLPYTVNLVGLRSSSLSDQFRHSVKVSLYSSIFDRSLDFPAISHTVSLPALNSNRLGVTYEPASVADAELIQNHKDQGSTTLPVYLIRVKPLIQLDGLTIAEGPTVTMGEAQYWNVSLIDPSNLNSGTEFFNTIAGDELVFGVNGNGITAELVYARLLNERSETAAENLHQVALHFWMEHDLFDALAAERYDVYQQRMPSVGLFSSPLAVSYFFGIARSGSYKGRQMDVKRVRLAVVAPDRATQVSFLTQAGAQGSYLEGSVFDQLFGRPQSTGLSAMQLIALSSRQAIPIYTITGETINTILPRLAISSEVKSDIQNAINAGKVAIVPEQEITVGNYAGIGYVIQDPETGEGAYLIDGGLNGGVQPDCGDSIAARADPILPVALAFVAPYRGYPAIQRILLLVLAGMRLLNPVALAVTVAVALIMAVYVIRLQMIEEQLEQDEDNTDCKCEPEAEECETCETEFPEYNSCVVLPSGYQCANEVEAIQAAEVWTGLSPLDGPASIVTEGPCIGQGTHITLFDITNNHPASAVSCECCTELSGTPQLEEWWGVVEATNPRHMLSGVEVLGTGQCTGKP